MYTYNDSTVKTKKEVIKMASVDVINQRPLPNTVKDETGKILYDSETLRNVALDYIFNHIL